MSKHEILQGLHYTLQGEDWGGFTALIAILPLLRISVGNSYPTQIGVLLVVCTLDNTECQEATHHRHHVVI